MNAKVAKKIRKQMKYHRAPVVYVGLFNSRKSSEGTQVAIGVRGIYKRLKKTVSAMKRGAL